MNVSQQVTSGAPMPKTIRLAMFAMMADIPAIPKRGRNPFTKSDYMLLDDLVNTLYPLAREHGLMIIQSPSMEMGNILTMTTQVIHVESGEYIENVLGLPMGDKPSSQELGSGITYLRRYSLAAVFGIVSESDDDGNAGSKKTKKVTTETVKTTAPMKEYTVKKFGKSGIVPPDPPKKKQENTAPGAVLSAKDFKDFNDKMIKLQADAWKVASYLRKEWGVTRVPEITYGILDQVIDHANLGFFMKDEDVKK